MSEKSLAEKMAERQGALEASPNVVEFIRGNKGQASNPPATNRGKERAGSKRKRQRRTSSVASPSTAREATSTLTAEAMTSENPQWTAVPDRRLGVELMTVVFPKSILDDVREVIHMRRKREGKRLFINGFVVDALIDAFKNPARLRMVPEPSTATESIGLRMPLELAEKVRDLAHERKKIRQEPYHQKAIIASATRRYVDKFLAGKPEPSEQKAGTPQMNE